MASRYGVVFASLLLGGLTLAMGSHAQVAHGQDLSVAAVPEAVLEYVERVSAIHRSNLLFSRRPAEAGLDVYRVVVPLEVQGVPDSDRVFEVLYDRERRVVTAERAIRPL